MSAKGRVLTADPAGLARLIRREAQTMHPLQVYRETVQNGIEAGASIILIDGWESPAGYLIARISDNGKGMSNDKMVHYLATALKTDKGDLNFGVGARISALPSNPAGVGFASRTESEEGLVKLKAYREEYNFEAFPVIVDGAEELHEVIKPKHGELARIGATGTAVMLHGDGKAPTWSAAQHHAVVNFLARRYYRFPDNVVVGSVSPTDNKRYRIIPFGSMLAKMAKCDGQVPFKDIAGLSGVIFWWTLPSSDEMRQIFSGSNVAGASGIGIVHDDEIFHYAKTYMSDFGIQYKSVQQRVCILIHIDGAQMDTGRSTIVHPNKKGTEKKTTPWKMLGAYFAEHMPAEIDELLSSVVTSSSVFTSEEAKKLDPEWMKWIKPVMVAVPAAKSRETGAGKDKPGNSLDKGTDHQGEGNGGKRKSPELAAHRLAAGYEPAVLKPKVVTPRVEFVEASEMPEDHPHIMWVETTATIMISKEFPPYKREIQRWIEKTDHPMSLVESAVKEAYSIEYAAYIVDANGQRAAKLTPEAIDALKSDSALYAKALGCQSLTQMVEDYLERLIKAA